MVSEKKWSRLVTKVVLAVLLLSAFVLLLVAVFDWADSLSERLEKLSALIAVIDDLLVRLVAVALLVIAAGGIIVNELRILSGRPTDDSSSHYFKLIKFGALVGISGAAFFAAYPLDEMDDKNFNWFDQIAAGTVSAPPTVLARWVQVVPAEEKSCRMAAVETSVPPDCPYYFLVRALVDQDARCPKVEVKYAGKRDKSVTLKKRDFRPQPGLDQVRVCQARLDGERNPQSITFPDKKTIDVTSRWPKREGPQRVVAFGDTGCRADDEQRCVKSEWRLAQLAKQVVDETRPDNVKPDLVVYLGDFMYVKFDAWDTWKASFFDPAEPLLTAAPWIMVRGNHERCGKFGDTPHGFYLFFDVGEMKNCKDGTDAGDAELTDTYAVDLSETHRVIVVDSAIAYANDVRGLRKKEIVGEKDRSVFATMKQVLGQVRRLAQGQKNKNVWLATHVPVFALEECKKKDERTGKCGKGDGDIFAADSPESSAMMRVAWKEAEVTGVTTILAGDRHLFQVIDAGDTNPLQITVGTGGVNLDPHPLEDAKSPPCQPKVGVEALPSDLPSERVPGFARDWRHCSLEAFGYLLAKKNNTESFDMTFEPLSD